jgi:tetratricopeptide (TPR) repeat protein
VLTGLGEAALEAGRLPDAVDSLEEAIDAHGAAGDPRAAARTAVVLSEVLVLQHDRRRFEMLSGALALLEPLPPGPEHVALLTEMAGEYQYEQPETGLEVASRALALAAELGLGRPARTLGYRASNRTKLGDPDAGDDYRDALELALAAGQARPAATIYHNWANHRYRFEGAAHSLETHNRGIAFCRARGLSARVTFAMFSALPLLFDVGEHDQALAVAEGVVDRARSESEKRLLAQAKWVKTNVMVFRGQAERLASMPDEVEAGLDDATTAGERYVRLRIAARIRAALGQREAAIALLTRLAGEHPDLSLTVSGLLLTAETAIGLGEIDLAERFTPPNAGAALAEARGDLGTAAQGYAGQVERSQSRGEVVWVAKHLVGLGRVLARLGRTDEAAQALNEARPTLVRLDGAPLLAEVDALLGQLTAVSA